ncbi:hypothetical protein [Ornithinimicrobium pekingense]|uniref:Lipoprotein n=2 Tax=Ornithinimicrobium pekingense TaxID=384677 RepID=A0ABQ2FB49_9MICO|nr:hypothetical protein [Ornithinimicrobium pekingense]GGK71564.1 hypothetical protein GCM10011509_20070 [Ornithinimicrobium pekingense]
MTRRHAGTSVAALLAGTLALAACGTQTVDDTDRTVSQADVAEDARKARLAARPSTLTAADLSEDVRKARLQAFPETAGMEVPPAGLTPRKGGAAHTGIPRAEMADEGKVTAPHTGIPRAEMADEDSSGTGGTGTRVDGADIGWPGDGR